MGINKNFVVKNGLEVDTNLILANANTNRVGIGTSLPSYRLHVYGGIGGTHISVSGVATVQYLDLIGSVSAGNTTGGSFQYLRANGNGGVEWAALPELRSSQTYTATASQIDFPFTATVAYVDVFVNGVKLSSTSYTYSPGLQITLSDPAFSGDIVEIIGYATNTVGSSAGAVIAGVTVLENGIIKGAAGLVTSINFVGPTVGVTTSGYGVTVYSAGGGGGGDSYWEQTATGIHTLSNVGVGTTNATSKLTVSGDILVSGVATLGVTTVGTSTATTGLFVKGGINATGVVTASYFEGDGSRITGLTALAVNTGWDQSNVGLGTTAKVGIGTTNPLYQLVVGKVGDSGTSLYVHGSIVSNENLSIANSISSYGAKIGDISIQDGNISAPALVNIGGTAVRVLGDLYVNGTQFISSTVTLQVENKIIGIGSTVPATDITADGGGIRLYGDTNKDLLWDNAKNAWVSNVNIDVGSSNYYSVNGEQRLSYNSLTVPNAVISAAATISNVIAGKVSAATSITALTFHGSGNALTGIVTSIVAGSNITITNSTGRVVISATGVGTTGGGGGGGNGVSVSIGDSAPIDPVSGSLWYDSSLGRGFIYYIDDDSAQWVDFSPNGGVPSNAIYIKNNGSPLSGAVSSIDFVGDLNISYTPSGIATVALPNYWATSVTGIHTTSNVGIGTTNATSKLTVVGDVKVGVNTSQGLILTAPNGTAYRLIVDNSGTLSTVPV